MKTQQEELAYRIPVINITELGFGTIKDDFVPIPSYADMHTYKEWHDGTFLKTMEDIDRSHE